MKPVFADTYYWLALVNPRDRAHQDAVCGTQDYGSGGAGNACHARGE